MSAKKRPASATPKSSAKSQRTNTPQQASQIFDNFSKMMDDVNPELDPEELLSMKLEDEANLKLVESHLAKIDKNEKPELHLKLLELQDGFKIMLGRKEREETKEDPESTEEEPPKQEAAPKAKAAAKAKAKPKAQGKDKGKTNKEKQKGKTDKEKQKEKGQDKEKKEKDKQKGKGKDKDKKNDDVKGRQKRRNPKEKVL